MNIIEFLSQNLFFVIIIIGFLLSLLGKGQKQQGKGTNRMPDFGSGNRPDERRVPPERRTTQTPQQVEQRMPERQPYPEQSSSFPNHEENSLADETAQRMEEEMRHRQKQEEEDRRREQQRRARQEQRRRELEEQQRQEGNGDRAVAAASSGPVRPGETLPGANELTSAVLWAEILGPPRAKRPFR